MKNIFINILTILLAAVAPVISSMAFYEYMKVKFLSQKPTYPFGRSLMHTLDESGINQLAGYEKEMLTIALFFFAIAILLYVSFLIKTLFRLAFVALLVFAGYVVYHFAG